MAKVIKGSFPGAIDRGTIGTLVQPPVPDYVLELSVSFSDPEIWRRVSVPGTMTLGQLHRVIQACMGWQDCDAHRFLVGKIFYGADSGRGNEAKTRLQDLEAAMNFIFTYLYDAGQGWELEISLVDTVLPSDPRRTPELLAGEGDGPPEATGDIHHYQAVRTALLEAGADPGSLRCKAPGFEGPLQGRFDLQEINRQLRHLFPPGTIDGPP